MKHAQREITVLKIKIQQLNLGWIPSRNSLFQSGAFVGLAGRAAARPKEYLSWHCQVQSRLKRNHGLDRLRGCYGSAALLWCRLQKIFAFHYLSNKSLCDRSLSNSFHQGKPALIIINIMHHLGVGDEATPHMPSSFVSQAPSVKMYQVFMNFDDMQTGVAVAGHSLFCKHVRCPVKISQCAFLYQTPCLFFFRPSPLSFRQVDQHAIACCMLPIN